MNHNNQEASFSIDNSRATRAIMPRVLEDVYGIQQVDAIDPARVKVALELAMAFQDPASYRPAIPVKGSQEPGYAS